MKKAVVFLAFVVSLFALDGYQVAFETTECNGEKGFATVDMAKIDRIESDDCRYNEKKLQKMLVKSGGSYAVYRLTFDEAREVMKDVRLYNRAKLRMMENATPVVITK